MSKPIDPDICRTILPGGQPIMDTRRLFSAIRLRSDGRFHISADGPPFKSGKAARGKAERRLLRLFPQLGRVEWEEEWRGWIAVSPRQYPALHQPADNIWATLGYSGRGLAFGLLMGRDIAHRILGDRNRSPVFPVEPVVSQTAARIYARSLIGLYRLLDFRETRNQDY